MSKLNLETLLAPLSEGERAAFLYLVDRLKKGKTLKEISVGEIFDVLYFTKKNHAAKKGCALFADNDYYDANKQIPAGLYNFKISLK